MPPAVAAAGIMAAGTIGGAVLGGSAQRSAANQANAAQQEATQAQLQLGRESMALNRDIYNSNYALGSPFIANGLGASNAMTALLGVSPAAVPANPLAGGGGGVPATQPPPTGGLPTSGVPAAPGGPTQANPVYSQQPIAGSPSFAGILSGLARPGTSGVNPFLGPEVGLPSIGPGSPGSNDVAGSGGNTLGLGGVIPRPQVTPGARPVVPGTAPAPGATPGTTPAPGMSAQDAFENFANSAGMQFQLDQGADMINNRYAALGQLQSGAAMKALQGYGQQTALNNYFLPYMGLLGGQQAMGAGMASSVMGVGQNFGNTAAGINAGMGANIQNGANAASNAALARGQANAGMWSGIGSALGGLGSSLIPAPAY